MSGEVAALVSHEGGMTMVIYIPQQLLLSPYRTRRKRNSQSHTSFVKNFSFYVSLQKTSKTKELRKTPQKWKSGKTKNQDFSNRQESVRLEKILTACFGVKAELKEQFG